MDSQHLVKYVACRGTLSWNGSGTQYHTAIIFDVEVDRAGEVHVIVEDQPLTRENFWIKTAFSSSSPVAAALDLEGRNADGLILTSDSVHLTSVHTWSTANATTLKVKAKAQRLTAAAGEDVQKLDECQVEYWVAGLRWFHGAQFAIAEGEIAIAGAVNLNDYSEVAGRIVIRSPAPRQDLEPWLAEVDAAVNRVLDVVSFADGHFMRPTVRQVFKGEKLARIDFLGKAQGSSPHKPPLHYLDFTNSLPPLIQAYTQDLIDLTGLNVAIEWHLMPHLYNEARFVSQMTAIEHLIHVFSGRSPDATYLNKALFNKEVAPVVVEALKQALAQLTLGDEERRDATEGMTQTIKGMNRRNLRSNLDRMMRTYRVPIGGLEDRIKPLVDMRNDIVHRGLAMQEDADSELVQRVAEAEELLRRIIFALLGFQGWFRSWLDKVEDREFRITT